MKIKFMILMLIIMAGSIAYAESFYEYVGNPWLSTRLYWDYSEEVTC